MTPALTSSRLRALFTSLGLLGCWLAAVPAVRAQRPYQVARAPERSATERVIIRTVPVQRTKGVLAVVLTPILNGKVVVKDARGRLIAESNAGERGQAEFELPRRQVYQIEATHPGYFSAASKSQQLSSTTVVRLTLTPQFARLALPGLPLGAQVFIDDQLRATADASGFADLTPGNHLLSVRHPEYNDYQIALEDLKAGDGVTFPPMRTLLTRVAKLTIQCYPGASILIDGEFQGRINADGQVRIDYGLTQAAEHTITAELVGYQTWSSKELLKPGPRTLAIKLNPVLTSTGTTDGFDSLSQWDAPGGWQLAKEKVRELNVSKLQVSGASPGLLKDKTYRDFEAIFTIWLSDEKGATWILRASQNKQNFYLFHLTGLRAGELTPRKLYTYRVKDGQVSEVQPPTPLTFDFKEKDNYVVNIQVRGYEIKHKLTANSNGEESEASFTDTLNDRDLFLYGTLGFLSFKGETFQVDDFTVIPLQN
jgi:hypothetical protein